VVATLLLGSMKNGCNPAIIYTNPLLPIPIILIIRYIHGQSVIIQYIHMNVRHPMTPPPPPPIYTTVSGNPTKLVNTDMYSYGRYIHIDVCEKKIRVNLTSTLAVDRPMSRPVLAAGAGWGGVGGRRGPRHGSGPAPRFWGRRRSTQNRFFSRQLRCLSL
jgi:hypothetical protein